MRPTPSVPFPVVVVVIVVVGNSYLRNGGCSWTWSWAAASDCRDSDEDFIRDDDVVRDKILLAERRAQSGGGEKGRTKDSETHFGVC